MEPLAHDSFGQWSSDRPNTLVIACSDGRLQEATDEFLSHHLDIHRYDRLYVPGGGGALGTGGGDFLRAYQLRRECRYLVDLHEIRKIVVLFHGPTHGGRIEAACADYRRKLPWASVSALRERQEQDASDLSNRREDWAGSAEVLVFRCEVAPNGYIRFVDLSARVAR